MRTRRGGNKGVLKKKVLGMPLLVFLILLFAFVLILFGLILGPILGSFVPQQYTHLDELGHRYFGPSWLHVETPKPELKPGVLFQAGWIPVTNTMITAW